MYKVVPNSVMLSLMYDRWGARQWQVMLRKVKRENSRIG